MKNSEKIILDLCGGTGAWSRPYKEAGYDVRLITLPQYDVRQWMKYETEIVDCVLGNVRHVYGILAAPPCTMFSFARTNAKKPRALDEGMECVRACFDIIWSSQEWIQDTRRKTTNLKFWAMENPARGLLRNFLGKPAFTFNPYEFGDGYKKETAIWGNFKEPKKVAKECVAGIWNSKTGLVKFDKLKTKQIHPEKYGQLTRTERRAITPAGFAKAFFESNQ